MVLLENIKIPQVKVTCCGINYNSLDPKDVDFFRAFWHKNIHTKIKAAVCLTIWLTCKNNACIHAHTFYYNKAGILVNKTTSKKIAYIKELQDVFIENVKIKPKTTKNFDMSKKYLWKYGKSTDGKKQNIYTFNDIKTGENTKPLITVRSVI